MKNFNYLQTLIFLFASTIVLNAQIDGLPENAESGKCYVKCTTPDEFKEVTETIIVKPSYKTVAITPAVYKDVTETVVIKEASVRYEYVPAVYETIEVPYTAKEGRTDLEPVAAVFSNDSEKREVYPKVSKFEYAPFPDCASGNPNDCQALCWLEYPAKSQTIPVKRLASDATTKNVPVSDVPASYKKQIIKEPAKYVEVQIPEVTESITKTVLVTPAQVVETVVPEETTTITKTVLVKKGGMTSWEEVECSLINPTILPIYYDYNSANLRPDSKTVIDTTIFALMTEQANISVEIGSHTDSRGRDSYNLDLSQRRAQSVVNYLVSKGISKSRLIAKGHGETKLINRCANGVSCSETEHQENRRTDFRVINK